MTKSTKHQVDIFNYTKIEEKVNSFLFFCRKVKKLLKYQDNTRLF